MNILRSDGNNYSEHLMFNKKYTIIRSFDFNLIKILYAEPLPIAYAYNNTGCDIYDTNGMLLCDQKGNKYHWFEYLKNKLRIQKLKTLV